MPNSDAKPSIPCFIVTFTTPESTTYAILCTGVERFECSQSAGRAKRSAFDWAPSSLRLSVLNFVKFGLKMSSPEPCPPSPVSSTDMLSSRPMRGRGCGAFVKMSRCTGIPCGTGRVTWARPVFKICAFIFLYLKIQNSAAGSHTRGGAAAPRAPLLAQRRPLALD